MKLYHISQNVNNDYDTYSDLVVCANSENEARNIHPSSYKEDPWNNTTCFDNSWCKSPDEVIVEYIGEAASHVKSGIICRSFHAG